MGWTGAGILRVTGAGYMSKEMRQLGDTIDLLGTAGAAVTGACPICGKTKGFADAFTYADDGVEAVMLAASISCVMQFSLHLILGKASSRSQSLDLTHLRIEPDARPRCYVPSSMPASSHQALWLSQEDSSPLAAITGP